MLPKVLSNITFEHLGDETLAFNPSTGKAHCLSPSASLVLRACVDQVSREEALERLRVSGDSTPEETLTVSVGTLYQEGLLESDLFSTRIERREFLVGAGAAAATVFAASVVAPAPAQAQSCQDCLSPTKYAITNLAGLCTAPHQGHVGCKCCPANTDQTCVFVREKMQGEIAESTGQPVPNGLSEYRRYCYDGEFGSYQNLPVCATGAFSGAPHPGQVCRCPTCVP